MNERNEPMNERNEPMNEMKLLEDMCAAVPPPDADSLAAVRARVLGDGRRPPASPARPGRSHRGRGRRPALSQPRLVLGGGVAVAVAVAAAVVVAGGLPFGGGSTLVTSAQAAQVLQRAAVAALTQPVPRDGQFVYTEITGSEGIFTAPGSPATVRERMWQSADGSSAGTIEAAPCVMLTPGGDNAPFAGPLTPGQSTPPPLSRCELAIPLGHNLPAVASYAGLRTLPASPGALLAYIHAHVRAAHFFNKDTGPRLTWDALVEILRDDVAVPPKLAAAMFRAAATLPGTVVLHVVDAAGRPGIAVAMQEYGLSTELIFDPHTYRFTGSADVVTSSGEDTGNYPIGTIFFAMAVLRTAITSTAPVIPASDTYVFQPSTIGDFSR
jgi:hypothetical protein